MSVTGEFKFCPFCKEQIRAAAVKCRFCGEWLEQPLPPGKKFTSADCAEDDNKPDVLLEPLQSNQKLTSPTEKPIVKASEQNEETQERPPPKSELTESRSRTPQTGVSSLLPLFFIGLWIFGYVIPLAIRNGASGALGIVIGTIRYCTTPGSIVLLPLLGIWFWTARRKQPLFQTLSKSLRRPGWPLLLTIVGCLCLFAFSYAGIHSALEFQNVAQHQKLKAAGVNPDALKDWEVAKGADQSAVDARLGFPAATKKRMRETFALSLMGAAGPASKVKVELQGPEHDKLVLSSPEMNGTIASNFPVLLKTADVDFWNRMKFLGFSEFTFSGPNYYESIPAAKFAQLGTGYDKFVSNMVAIYDKGFSQSQSATGGISELNPPMQKAMRQNFASVFKGAFSAIYKTMDVRLEGEEEDRLVFYIKEMDAATANELLKALKDSKENNFGNALRAMAFQELTFKGDNYHISYFKTNFVDWSHNYENYLSELRKAAERVSGAVKSE
jgi:hypothetical protein